MCGPRLEWDWYVGDFCKHLWIIIRMHSVRLFYLYYLGILLEMMSILSMVSFMISEVSWPESKTVYNIIRSEQRLTPMKVPLWNREIFKTNWLVLWLVGNFRQ